jgi:K+-sensing histidine kinase KdpD
MPGVRGASSQRYVTLLAAAAALPLLVAAGLVPWRDDLANTHVALILVLVVGAVAAPGRRAPGVVAAVGAALWFDFYWTEPYQRLSIIDRTDLETALLLLLVGLGVTELAAWGRRQHELASRQAGYLTGIADAANAFAVGDRSDAVIEAVAAQLTHVLGLRGCRFDYNTGLDAPRLRRDGSVVWRHEELDVDTAGLPADRDVELLVESGGMFKGRYLLSASAGNHPSRMQRRVAAALADQVGAALAEQEVTGPREP